jgi:hypothetical protein
MKLVLSEIRDTGSFKSYPQPDGDWATCVVCRHLVSHVSPFACCSYKNAPQEVLDVVDQKLRDLTYADIPSIYENRNI